MVEDEIVREHHITYSMYTNLSKHQELVKDRGAWCAAVQGWQRVKHHLETEQQQIFTSFLNTQANH